DERRVEKRRLGDPWLHTEIREGRRIDISERQLGQADYVSVMAGAFDQPTGLRFGYHIYCADKADYYEVADSAPRFSAGRTSGVAGD
ncbi:MAG: hypothetical protein QMD99_21555, partial [Rhizobiaceae bacterium]|nr:hypothetical protein [Rhizobiaceae bacterium]